jgi:rhodanese-related sulfurtransferase
VTVPIEITREVVKQLIEMEAAQLVEVLARDQYEWAHLPGAVHISLGDIEPRCRELDPARPVIAYCNDFQ